MTMFFRKLRHKFINANQFQKYLLYAIGEVIILIFGILMALKVNNWNEEYKNRITEIAILKSMKTELKSDLLEIEVNIGIHEIGIKAAEKVVYYLENDLAYNDSLAIDFLDLSIYTHHSYKKGAYTTLEYLGIGIISSDSLRNQIIELYTMNEEMLRQEKYMADRISNAEYYLFNNKFDQLGNIDFDLPHDKSFGRMIPNDYKALKKDKQFLFYVKTYRNNNIIYSKWWYNDLRAKVENLIKHITNELIVLET